MRARGMTLIEVMATLAVATVMMGLSVVGFGGAIDRRKESAAIQSVGEAANEARMRARKYRQPVRLTVTVSGPRRSLRWERLGCADSWGSVCPSVECASSACGVGGCVCPEVGEAIALPPGLTLAAPIEGLCFSPGSGAPKVRISGKFCDAAAPAPAANALSFVTRGRVSHVLEVEAMTGAGRVVDCLGAGRDPVVCP